MSLSANLIASEVSFGGGEDCEIFLGGERGGERSPSDGANKRGGFERRGCEKEREGWSEENADYVDQSGVEKEISGIFSCRLVPSIRIGRAESYCSNKCRALSKAAGNDVDAIKLFYNANDLSACNTSFVQPGGYEFKVRSRSYCRHAFSHMISENLPYRGSTIIFKCSLEGW